MLYCCQSADPGSWNYNNCKSQLLVLLCFYSIYSIFEPKLCNWWSSGDAKHKNAWQVFLFGILYWRIFFLYSTIQPVAAILTNSRHGQALQTRMLADQISNWSTRPKVRSGQVRLGYLIFLSFLTDERGCVDQFSSFTGKTDLLPFGRCTNRP